jgi:hypothetical protein
MLAAVDTLRRQTKKRAALVDQLEDSGNRSPFMIHSPQI